MEDTSMRIVQQLNPNDVLCGRGSGPNDYSGNIKFRALVMERRDEYLSTSNRASKAKIAREIVHYVQHLNPPGRFLEQVDGSSGKSSLWRIVSEEKALEKAKQALRQNRHRRGGSSSMGSGSFAMISPSPSMGSVDTNPPNTRMSNHHRSLSYTVSSPPINNHPPVGHVRSASHQGSLMYGSNGAGSPMHLHGPPPPPHRRDSSIMSLDRQPHHHHQHRRHRSDNFLFSSAPPPPPPDRSKPHRSHQRAYSDRYYATPEHNNYYHSAPPPPPPEHYYSYHSERDYYPSAPASGGDRKYFNNDYAPTPEEIIPVVDEDSTDEFTDTFDIMPDPVTSNKRTNFENPFEGSSDPFSRDYFPSTAEGAPPTRNRMFSTDSDISAIELDFDTNQVLANTPNNNNSNSPFDKDFERDPMSISNFPDECEDLSASKKQSDAGSNNDLMNFDMSYYVLQSLADDVHDL